MQVGNVEDFHVVLILGDGAGSRVAALRVAVAVLAQGAATIAAKIAQVEVLWAFGKLPTKDGRAEREPVR